MFGYVLPAKGDLKMRDFESYRAIYCGLCKELALNYGFFSRFLLNYDLVLVALLADALSGEGGEVLCEGCIANPLARRPTLYRTKGLKLAADALMLLSWHKLQDNLQDEVFFKKIFYALAKPVLHRMYKTAAARQPEIAQAVQGQMQQQKTLEAAQTPCLDAACNPSAKICEAIFMAAAGDENLRPILGRLGLFAGQIVYLLDAAEDYEEDEKRGGYNVFLINKLTKQQAIAAAQTRCRMAAGEIALCYNLLQPLQYKAILDNIFFLGLPVGIAFAGVKRNKRGSEHGHITSV